VIDQMSIGYSVPEGKSERDSDGNRIIKELKLYEFSAVTFPMNEAAIITGVKTIRDAVRQGKAMDAESQSQLAEMLDELKALLRAEPPTGTRGGGQPPELEALQSAIK